MISLRGRCQSALAWLIASKAGSSALGSSPSLGSSFSAAISIGWPTKSEYFCTRSRSCQLWRKSFWSSLRWRITEVPRVSRVADSRSKPSLALEDQRQASSLPAARDTTDTRSATSHEA